MFGHRKIFQIMSGVFVVYIVLHFLVLRDTPYLGIKLILNIVFVITVVVLFVLLLLNRYRS